MQSIATRKSPLALIQTQEVVSMLAMKNSDYKIVEIDSIGDKNKDIPLDSPDIPKDFFTKELDEAILNGTACWAVHSAKDLGYPLAKGIKVIAITQCVDNREALVTRGDIPLCDLKPNSIIGTSSSQRKKDILKLRNDLKILPIRGNIQERISKVESGEYHGVIVALCALKRLGLENRVADILDIKAHDLQGFLAVVAKEGRLDLEYQFKSIDIRKNWGKVYIAGAGEGGYDNLTVKVANLIESCDVVVYDDLIADDIKEKIGQKGEYVGKRADNSNSAMQEDISQKLFRLAKEGKSVLRLKGGDPFIFGRGGEEVEYLLSRFVMVDVVPGITTAFAAAAQYKIPLTHRGVSRSVAFVTASFKDAKEICVPNCDTVVYYMGGKKVSEIKSVLLDKSTHFNENTPVAIVSKIGDYKSSVIETVVFQMDKFNIDLPALIIVGESVAKFVGAKKMLYTGLDSEHVKEKLDYEVFHFPFIKTEPDEFSVNKREFDGIIFTSSQAVKYFSYKEKNIPLICIGEKTASIAKKLGFKNITVSPEPHSDALVGFINDNYSEKKFLYPCSNLSKNMLHLLKNVSPLQVYKTTSIENMDIDLSFFDAVYFSSPSTVKSFAKNFNSNFPKHLKYYSIGKFTTQELQTLGVETVFER